MTPRRRVLTALAVLGLAAIAALQAVAYRHARAMVCFVPEGERTAALERLDTFSRLKVLLLGVNLPRPRNRKDPAEVGLRFTTRRLTLPRGGELEVWEIPAARSRATVALFHGYADSKASLLSAAKEFHAFGYATVLVDFRGSGGSTGDTTTVGYREAEDVATVSSWLVARDSRAPLLYGVSMGAAAVLRAVGQLGAASAGLILEAPFDRMVTTAGHRFEKMGLPAFPFAQTLVFWGGRIAGFSALSHDPMDYARGVDVPTLLMYGDQDAYIRMAEVRAIFENLRGRKSFKVFEGLAHQQFVSLRPAEWKSAVAAFLPRGHDVEYPPP